MTVDFKEELNQEQLAAATAGDGPALILAAAGTGKTRTLVYRVACLVSRGIPADRILLLTFTNRAAQEMLARASALLGGFGAGMPWSGTFHHVANRMLRRHAGRIGFPRGFTILDQDDARSLMSACIKEKKLKAKEFPKRDVLLHVHSQSQNRQIALLDAIEQHFDGHDVDVGMVMQVLQRYRERKQELTSMDFDDLLVNCVTLLRDHVDVREQYIQQFAHVLVDEYQDTNEIQSEMVDLLVGPSGNLFVVGDDFQSIYAWRGADTRHILTFPERYPGTRIYKLETNYRSVPEVLDLANVTVACSQQPELFRKVMRPTRESHQRPLIARLRDGSHQALFVVDAIRSAMRDGYKADDIVVLYRAHFHAMELQVELTRNQIPHVVTSGIRFFEQAHIKDALCFLRMLHTDDDALALQRILMLLPGVGQATAGRIWKKMGGQFDASDSMQRAALQRGLPKGAQLRWASLEPVIEAYYDEALDDDGGRAVALFVEHFYDQYLFDTYENAQSRLEDIQELGIQFERFESVGHCLQDVALLTNLDAEVDPGTDKGKVRLSTVHQAKGLEWPVVLVLWVTEGMFPSSRSLQDSEDGEAEERRLFYVAATRAQNELILCVPGYRRMRDGGGMPCMASRFIDELPRETARNRRIGYI